MSGSANNYHQVGLDILQAARNELYLNMPYLDAVLCGLEFRPAETETVSIATNVHLSSKSRQ